MDSPSSDRAVVKSHAAENPSSDPFSLNYSFAYARTLVSKADGACEPGYSGELLEGHLNEQGDNTRNPIRWMAHVDAPGHIHWAVRVGDETAGFPADLTCRQNIIYAEIGAGPNHGSIGKFDAESLSPIKTIQFSVTPLLNQSFLEFHRERSMPLAISIIQDGGDRVALTIISQELEITLSKTYSLPAFATYSKDPLGRVTRCRVFRAQDGSGYSLVITDVARAPDGGPGEVNRMGIIRVGLDGALKWSRLYSFSASGYGPLTAKVASDSAILGDAAYGAKSGKSFVVKIEPDGRAGWAKIFDTPNMVFNDFHCDATPYRFIQPTLKMIGTSTSRGLPQAILLALDYTTGAIIYQTRFPGSFNGGAGLSDQKDGSLYVSTLGVEFARSGFKAGFKGIASISRFNEQLELLYAKEIIGAEASFPLLTCGPHGVNFLSYDFSKPFRGVGSAINDHLEPVDVPCSWTRSLNLAMENCSYSGTDVQCKEEPLDVEPGDGTAVIAPTSFNLVPLALKLDNGTEPVIASEPAHLDPDPVKKYSDRADRVAPKSFPRGLGDPNPVAYRAGSEIGTQPIGVQFSSEIDSKRNAVPVQDDPRYEPLDARLNKVYSTVRSTLSPEKKDELKHFEMDFLNRREKLRQDPDAFFALTEKQIALLQGMVGGAQVDLGYAEPRQSRTIGPGSNISSSPDGKYRIIRGKDLIVEGAGTKAAVLIQTLGPVDTVRAIYWSPDNEKVVVYAGDSSESFLYPAWLDGTVWKTGDVPETEDGGRPRHNCLNHEKFLRWISSDTFEMSNSTKWLATGMVDPAVRYKVQLTRAGAQAIQ